MNDATPLRYSITTGNNKRRHRQTGFILSVEAILILTILGIGLLVGIATVRDALFKWHMAEQDSKFIAAAMGTNPGVLIGEVVGFDQHETPLVPFIDYEPVANSTVNFRALIGVRDDRFTSRQPVFYTDNSCGSGGGDPCIAVAGSETANAQITNVLSLLGENGSISYLFALQGSGPTYGVGAGGTVTYPYRGTLYRQSGVAGTCPGTLNSMWLSQRVVTGSPCYDLQTPGFSIGAVGEFATATEVLDTAGNPVFDALIPPYATNTVSTPSTSFTTPPPAGE